MANPLYVFCGTGDHLWVHEREPVDSPASIDAMLEWMASTYGISRLYWRAGQAMLWDQHFKVGRETPLQYDWVQWKHHLLNDVKINDAAIASARRYGMQVVLYTGLFESGVQPDVGIVCPYLLEDKLRIEHPEWCAVDRWGERRCPGLASFCYPEVRRILVDRYADAIERYGYDGVNFYTYVENCGIRYPDEFGYNQPIVDEFNKTYPDIDLRRDSLTPAQKTHWYECRGRFVTDFLRELHAALSQRGAKVSVILDAVNPDYPQPWWGKEIAGTGLIHMDWRKWVWEGIVDELWVQLAPVAAQRATLDLLQRECRGTPVKLTFRAVDPLDAGWAPYVESGITPVAVITWARNGIERYSLSPTSPETLGSDDWRVRLQTVADIESGRIAVAASAVAALTTDPHVLVRRRAIFALAELGASDQVPAVEACLADPESSVRIAAAAALAKINRPSSAERLLAALEMDGYFQIKIAALDALVAMGEDALPTLLAGSPSANSAVREVSVRALGKLGRIGLPDRVVFDRLRSVALDSQEDERVRYFAVERLVGMRRAVDAAQQESLAADLAELVKGEASHTVRLRAAWGLGYLYGVLDSTRREVALAALAEGFRGYGDACRANDAAFGWRVFGNAMLQYHRPGRDMLEDMRQQTTDRWLAWIAYQVVHVPQRGGKIQLCTEAEAVATHAQFAPPFPGWRSW